MTYNPYDQMYFNKNFNYHLHYKKMYSNDKIQFTFLLNFQIQEKIK